MRARRRRYRVIWFATTMMFETPRGKARWTGVSEEVGYDEHNSWHRHLYYRVLTRAGQRRRPWLHLTLTTQDLWGAQGTPRRRGSGCHPIQAG